MPFKKKVLVFIYLIQDVDLALPILNSFRNRNINFQIYVTRDLLKKSPRVRSILRREGYSWKTHFFPLKVQSLLRRTLKKIQFLPSLKNTSGVLCIVETSAGPHRQAHRLTAQAKIKNIPTFTLQHGVDNIGLTYQDAEYPLNKIKINSDYIFTWGDQSTLLPDLPEATRERCIQVGCPKDINLPMRLALPVSAGTKIVSIFENLHWKRYSDEYRSQFLKFIEIITDSYPNIFFVLKSHHAGLWLSRSELFQSKKNILFLDPTNPRWEPFTAPSLIAESHLVVSTPSTVLLDAAMLKRPAVLLRFGIPASNYAPVFALDSLEQIPEILKKEITVDIEKRTQEFSERFIGDGQSARKIAEFVYEKTFPI